MMIPEKKFPQILALGGAWRVAAVDDVAQESQAVIRVEETPQVCALPRGQRREMPAAKAGEILGKTERRRWRMLFAPVHAARAGLTWANVLWGADEMNRRKGRHHLTMFAERDARRRWRRRRRCWLRW